MCIFTVIIVPADGLAPSVKMYLNIDGLMQERNNSIANALELCLSYTNQLIWCLQNSTHFALALIHCGPVTPNGDMTGSTLVQIMVWCHHTENKKSSIWQLCPHQWWQSCQIDNL